MAKPKPAPQPQFDEAEDAKLMRELARRRAQGPQPLMPKD